MAQWRDFEALEILPSTWTDGVEQLLSTYVSANFNLRVGSPANYLIISAGTGDAQVGIAISATPRIATADKTAAHPGGAAGSYDVWVTGHPESFGTSGGVEVDNTNREFGLKIGTPSGSGAESVSRKIATVMWDGSQIESLHPLVAVRSAPSLFRELTTLPTAGTPGSIVRKSTTKSMWIDVGTSWVSLGPAPGDIKPTVRNAAESGWVFLEGQAVGRTDALYADLFALVGVTFGAGNGSTTFNLPDLRGRVPVGADGTAGRLSVNDILGAVGGAERHTLTIAEMPPHNHTIGTAEDAAGTQLGVESSAFNNQYEAWTNYKGDGQSHNNMQPYQVVNWVVKL